MIDCVTLGRCCIFSLTSCVQAANNNDLGLHLERKPLRKKKKKKKKKKREILERRAEENTLKEGSSYLVPMTFHGKYSIFFVLNIS